MYNFFFLVLLLNFVLIIIIIFMTDKVALITGCSAGGIGHQIALELATQHNYTVYATARNLTKMEDLGSVPNIHLLELDVTSQDSITTAVQQIKDRHGSIDLLINNAGQLCIGPIVETSLSRVQQAFDVNVMGVARVNQAVAPWMMEQRRGTIVVVGSVSGYASTPWAGYYAASKAAIHTICDAMRMELKPFGVQVVVVAPGSVRSYLSANQQVELPPDSRYLSARQAIEQRAAFSQTGSVTPTDEFAKYVTKRLSGEDPLPAYITYGCNSLANWIMYYVPPFIRDRMFCRRFGVDKVSVSGMCPVAGKIGGGSGGGKCPLSKATAPECPIHNRYFWIGAAALCALASIWYST